MPRFQPQPDSEWQQDRQELADDYRRFNANEARLEREHFARAGTEEARQARVAKFLAEHPKLA